MLTLYKSNLRYLQMYFMRSSKTLKYFAPCVHHRPYFRPLTENPFKQTTKNQKFKKWLICFQVFEHNPVALD